ncbi:hypothetical protein ABTN36_18190, partial [Acinetobacter baumannii]
TVFLQFTQWRIGRFRIFAITEEFALRAPAGFRNRQGPSIPHRARARPALDAHPLNLPQHGHATFVAPPHPFVAAGHYTLD